MFSYIPILFLSDISPIYFSHLAFWFKYLFLNKEKSFLHTNFFKFLESTATQHTAASAIKVKCFLLINQLES